MLDNEHCLVDQVRACLVPQPVIKNTDFRWRTATRSHAYDLWQFSRGCREQVDHNNNRLLKQFKLDRQILLRVLAEVVD